MEGGWAAVKQSNFTVLPVSAWTCWCVIHNVGGTKKELFKFLEVYLTSSENY